VSVLLIRHAHAGDRSRWDAPDHLRPLTTTGRHEAAALVDVLAEHHVTRVLTSPYRRCVETVAPLAAARGLDLEPHDALAEGAPLASIRRLLDVDGAALCSHGDVVEAAVTDLAHRGVDVGERPRWAKGSTWVLDVAAGRARYLPAPQVGGR
jgi:phosphohistidine phosphatase SixA